MTPAKIGIMSDIHNNLYALDAVLSEFERQRCVQILCCGDILGIGAYPEETIRRLMSVDRLSACVLGNHDRCFITMCRSQESDRFLADASNVPYLLWESSLLSKTSKAFIQSLPLHTNVCIAGKTIHVTHYAEANDRYAKYHPYPAANDIIALFAYVSADIVCYGHNHRPTILHDDRWYINCGSLGCPGQEKNIARAGIISIGCDVDFKQLNLRYDLKDTFEEMERRNMPSKDAVKRFFYGVETPL